VSSQREFGEFLKARRAALTPADVGLTDSGTQRRVVGLRREEVAQLASMSVDYYTRLEQGRLRASTAILPSLARVLLLDQDQTAYLYQLAGRQPAMRRSTQRITPSLRRLLDHVVHTPAFVLGRRDDILAWNRAAKALFVDFDAIPAQERNYVRLMFLDPTIRALHANWERSARTAVSALRMHAARFPDDPELARLVGELSIEDPDFRTWWAGHVVTSTTSSVKHYHHPEVGELTLDCDTWASPQDPDQRLVILSAQPGTPSHDSLQILTFWTTPASPRAEPRGRSQAD
jgi:transcriptional regulator with XRE-family HTH domain